MAWRTPNSSNTQVNTMKIPDDSASSHPATEPARSSLDEGHCSPEREPRGHHSHSPEQSLNLSHELMRDLLVQLIDGTTELRDLPHRLRKEHQALPLGASSTSPVDDARFLRCEVLVLRAINEMLVANIRLLPRFLRTILAEVAGNGSPSRASHEEPHAMSGKPGFCGHSDTGWEPT